MKRRKALQNIGLGISAGLALPTFLSACKEEPGPEISYDGTVAVIGAGVSGLYVADILQEKGIKVVVFEASSRLGGRVRSVRQFESNPLNSDFPTELGAERIMGTDSVWAKIVKQLNIPLIEYETVGKDNFIINGAFTANTAALADPDVTAALNFLSNIKTYSGPDVSVQQAVQAAGLNPKTYAILNSWIGNVYHTSNERMSITALAEGLNLITRNNSSYILSSNPMQDVVNSRFSKVSPNILYNHAVKNIQYTGESVKINGTANDENFSQDFDKVIVTVPVSILKNNDLVFSPALPATKASALSRIGMDGSIRLVIEFKKNFWGADSAFLYGGTKAPEYFNAGIGRSALMRTLNITIGGAAAEALTPFTVASLDTVLAELDSVFGDNVASLNIRRDIDTDERIYLVQDWSQEEFIKGGGSYIKPGGSIADREALAQPVGNTLFFAGEATDVTGEWGTINGALLSAERAAQEVVESITA